MCTVCGCSTDAVSSHSHSSHCSHDHSHDHSHSHEHAPAHDHHYGLGDAGVSVSGFSQDKLIQIEKNILSKNDTDADTNRQWLADHNLYALNLLSSPGAGKTTLLVETLNLLKDDISVGVIEGDQETANDADRIRATGVPAVQINTGKGCHLDAHMVGHAIKDLPIEQGGVVLIENIGNLVCPAAFDLGEATKVVILSVTEGEDKPIKYPDMFAVADLLIISKIDLLPYVDFDVDQAIEFARRVNPDVQVLKLSARSGEGLQEWKNWIFEQKTLATAEQPLAHQHEGHCHA